MTLLPTVTPPHALSRDGSLSTSAARTYLLAALVCLAVFPYLNALSCGFTLDDEWQISKNPAVTRGIDPLLTFSSPLIPSYLYRPLTTLTFALNESLSPGNAAAYHAVNILLHLLVTLLVLQLGFRLFEAPRMAWLAAALFAVHPIHSEAVTSLVGRGEELAALFGLAALLAACELDGARDAWERRLWHAASVGSFVLAVCSKESALCFLPLIPLLRVVQRRQPLWSGLWQELRSCDWLPYVLCAALFAALRNYVVGRVGLDQMTPLDNVLAFVAPVMRVRSALGVLWDYFGLLNFPLVLAADYSHGEVAVLLSWADWRCLSGLLLLLSAPIVLLRYRNPGLAFAAIFPLATLALTSNLLFPIGTVKAERLLYLPSVGWALVVAYGLTRCMQSARYRNAAVACAALLITLFALRTWTRNRDWQDNATLFRSMVVGAPHSAKARYLFGLALYNEGREDEALIEFKRSLEIYPWEQDATLALGVAFAKRGQLDESAEWYRHTLQLEPAHSKAHLGLCQVLFESRRYPAAAQACRQGLIYSPSDADLLKGLGGSLIGMGERDKGLAVLKRALALNRSDESLRIYLAKLERVAASDSTAHEVSWE